MSTHSSTHQRIRLAAAVGLVVALYIALDMALVEVTLILVSHGIGIPSVAQQELAPTASPAPEREAVPPAYALAALLLGEQVGFASKLLAHEVVTGRQSIEQARDQAVRVANHQRHAEQLGIGPVAPLETQTLAQAARMSERIEADETGIALRVEGATTSRHRELFLLGMHLGVRTYDFLLAPEFDSTLALEHIERHARLAGIPETLWRPLAMAPEGANVEARRQRYLRTLNALHDAVHGGTTRP